MIKKNISLFFNNIINFLKDNSASFLSLTVAILFVILLLNVITPNPLNVISSFFIGILSSPFHISTVISNAALLMLASLGIAIGQKSGNFNLGGAAQIYLGGLIAALCLKNPNFPFPIALLLATCISGITAGLSSILKTLSNISEILTSFLISAAIIPIVDYSITGPLRDETKNLIATKFISENHRLYQFITTPTIDVTIIVATLLCIISTLYFKYSFRGKQTIIVGKAPEFAKYCGYNIDLISFFSMFTSGALHGISGFFAITGIYYTCHIGFYGGLSWDAISVALIAQNNPIGIIIISFVMSYIFTSCEYISMMNSFQFDLTSLIQAIILFTITSNIFMRRKNHGNS